MPEIKCEYGHAQCIGTDEWVEQLTLDQLRYAHQQMGKKIQTAEDSPRRTVWLVDGGVTIVGFYREEEYEKAADHFLRIFKDVFMTEAAEFKGGSNAVSILKQFLPSIEPRRVTQFEYDTEWFPPLNPA